MTVALVLAGEADAGLCGQLAALGVRRVDVADRTGPGLLTVAAAARTASERVLICVGKTRSRRRSWPGCSVRAAPRPLPG